jgi:nucleotide-binding universal stress UspA family protein
MLRLPAGQPVGVTPEQREPPASPPEAHRTPRHAPILLAADGTGRSNAPITAAGMIARRLGAPLHGIAVIEPREAAVHTRHPTSSPVDDRDREGIETLARERIHAVLGAGAPDALVCREGTIARVVADQATRIRASLVVIGGISQRTVLRGIAGERAQELIRLAGCPVLAVHPDLEGLARCVVVGMDFSPASVLAAQAALLALADGGRLILVHIAGDPRARHPTDAELRKRNDLMTRVEAMLAPHRPEGARIEMMSTTGPVAERLLGVADGASAELIAIGTHAATGEPRPYNGSVAAIALHTAGRSVLVHPPPRPAQAFRVRIALAGSATSTDKREWPRILDELTRRNRGRTVTIEVDDPEVGAQVQVAHAELLGVTYDPRDGRVDIMLGDPASRAHHLTRGISGVQSIAACSAPDGREAALELRHGKGHTLVVLHAAAE